MLQLLQIAADGGAGSAQIWAGEGPWQLKLARQIALGVSITGAQILVAAQMAQLADGGIIAGTKKTGDQNVVRVNANEMILNEQQQSTLWKVANGAKIPDNMNNINSYKTSTPNNIDMSGDIIIQGNVTDNQLDKISNIKAQQMIDLNKLVQQLEELNFRGILRPIINNSGVF
jgi:hypothetical protein